VCVCVLPPLHFHHPLPFPSRVSVLISAGASGGGFHARDTQTLPSASQHHDRVGRIAARLLWTVGLHDVRLSLLAVPVDVYTALCCDCTCSVESQL
jgi:hypothetical protein